MMKKALYIALTTGSLTAVTASAALIASESFDTTTSATDYTPGKTFTEEGNQSKFGGTFGFTPKEWFNGTGAIKARGMFSLTHNGLVGSSAERGVVEIDAGNSNRNSQRELASPPASGSVFFMSGLVYARNTNTDGWSDGQGITMGLSSNALASSVASYSGLHLGLLKEGGEVYLAAFAGGNSYKLGDALTAAQKGQTQQIVLKLDLDAGGEDTLTAWVAQAGAIELTQALSINADIFDSAADLRYFTLQRRGGTSGSGIVELDEWRFGTTLESVTVIPEPATLSLFILSGIGCMLFRRVYY